MSTSNYDPWTVDASSWERATTVGERLRALAAYGLLAPSPHNSQPWIFEIRDDQLHLAIDSRRVLPVSDPTGRQMPLTIGCVVATLEAAAIGLGVRIEVDWHGDARRLCSVRLAEMDLPANRAYLDAITMRRSDRRPYQTELASRYVDDLKDTTRDGSWVRQLVDREEIVAFADAVGEATAWFGSNAAFRRELAGWLRHNATHRCDGMPGSVMGFTPIQTLVMKKMLPFVNAAKPMAKQARAQCVASGVIALVGVEPGSEGAPGHFAVGRTAATFAIECTRLGLAASWIAAASEHEVVATRLVTQLALPGEFVIALRAGASNDPAPNPTPRRSVTDVLRQPPPSERGEPS